MTDTKFQHAKRRKPLEVVSIIQRGGLNHPGAWCTKQAGGRTD